MVPYKGNWIEQSYTEGTCCQKIKSENINNDLQQNIVLKGERLLLNQLQYKNHNRNQKV